MNHPRVARRCINKCMLALFGLAVAMLVTHCTSPSRADDSAAIPAKVQQALDLLADPDVSVWLRRNARASAPLAPVAEPASNATPWSVVSLWLSQTQRHLAGLSSALLQLPAELTRIGERLRQDMLGRSFLEIGLLVGSFALLGYGLEWLYWRATGRLRESISILADDTLAARGRGVVLRMIFGVGIIVSFALGSVGAFLLFDWPPLIRDIVLGFLGAALIYRFAAIVGRLLLAPPSASFRNTERYRLIPVGSETAKLWQSGLAALAGWVAVAFVSMGLLAQFGMDADLRGLIGAAFMLGPAVIATSLVWWQHGIDIRRSSGDDAALASDWLDRRSHAILLTGYFLFLWLLWIAGLYGLYWVLLLVVLVPWLLRLIRKTLAHVQRPDTAFTGPAHPPSLIAPSLIAVGLERGLIALVLIGAGSILIRAFSLDVMGLASGESPLVKLLRGGLQAIVIVLIADIAWHLLSAWINRWLHREAEGGDPESDKRHARLRTLLPILRNMLMIVIVMIGALMALSALGIEIGPLIAGAGVMGVAIGFGAQTIVKDIISGMFYLLDDAFRVGEYIQSGSYKGTVESFSLRSVKLRHHRGPLFTVPFSELGAVQNMSRDWVVDKISIGVTYDTDLAKVKQIVKQVGKELLADPEFGSQIIEPLKMQGVEAFGDFAIQVRLKFMTKPGDAQFAVKRRAFALIKQAFDKNGVKFAFPTVQVAGGVAGEAAAAAVTALGAPAK